MIGDNNNTATVKYSQPSRAANHSRAGKDIDGAQQQTTTTRP